VRPRSPRRGSPSRAAPGQTRSAARSASSDAGDRLQKVLAQAGIASRREAEEWIKAGRITVNGKTAELGQRVLGRDEVKVDGRVLRRVRDPARLGLEVSVFLCHRSPGQSLKDELIPKLPRKAGRRFLAVSPMPGVDGGLELVTTDGALASRLQRHVRHWPTEFLVRVRGELESQHREAIMLGELDDGRKLAVAELEGSEEFTEGANRWYRVLLTGASGKDVRQLFERHGALVSRIQRMRLGPLALTRDLNRGHFRGLNEDEVRLLRVESAAADPAGLRPE